MESQVQEYLGRLLKKSSAYTISSEDNKLIEKSGMEAFIYAKLTSKKFRKFKMTESSISHTQQAIKKHTTNIAPIQIVYPQGGYKLWRFPSSPEVDWAEFFNMAYVIEYLSPIAAAYKPGIKMTYYLHTLLMEVHGNLTKEEIKAYGDSFEKLLKEFSQYLPANISLQVLRDADLYTREEYFAELEEKRKTVEREYKSYTPELKVALANMARLNIKWEGNEDWTQLSDKQREEKVYLAAIYEKAATMMEKAGKRVKSPENILLFNKAAGNFIGIGTTKASIAKYWVGYGVLQKKDEGFLPIILTPKQFEKADMQSAKKIPVNLLEGKNFSSIMIFDKPFSFE